MNLNDFSHPEEETIEDKPKLLTCEKCGSQFSKPCSGKDGKCYSFCGGKLK